jgi:hypothetical protein
VFEAGNAHYNIAIRCRDEQSGLQKHAANGSLNPRSFKGESDQTQVASVLLLNTQENGEGGVRISLNQRQ